MYTTADKDSCVPIIDLLVECAKIARFKGILELEEFAKEQGNDFLTFALMMVVDGTDPRLIKDILETLINADGHTGAELLQRTIIAEGVLSVQAGENPRITAMKLTCFLGEDYLRKAGHIPTAQ